MISSSSCSEAPFRRASRRDTSDAPNRHTCSTHAHSSTPPPYTHNPAHLEVAISSQAKSITSRAEVLTHGGDKSQLSFKAGHMVGLKTVVADC